MDADRADARTAPGTAAATWHALTWLVFGNSIGVMLSTLLLVPQLNVWLGEWTYGRWIMVHMNTALFGWASLPMLAYLFRVYGAESGRSAGWCRALVWLWSAALLVGCASWLNGNSSGKLFLDWSGFARAFFIVALLALWGFLARSFVQQLRARGMHGATAAMQALGLLVLLAVPAALYLASNPAGYPHVNPDTGGPTGQSQLESSLGVVALLLMVPPGIAQRRAHSRGVRLFAWCALAAEAVLCVLLGRADVSHRAVGQWLSLASLLLWVPAVPAYYGAFVWKAETAAWRRAFQWWWGGLVVTGWILFLPGVLDRVKFTDALVAHSLMAMAGFLSAFLLFVMTQLLAEKDAWVLTRPRSFALWNAGVLAYVVLMFVAGWLEAANPGFTAMPGPMRNLIYSLRLLTGVAMLAASLDWWLAALSLSGSWARAAVTRAEVEAA
jgi:cytochrome c oxidase cbb3-type subunit 1